MKKWLSVLVGVLLTVTVLTACGGNNNAQPGNNQGTDNTDSTEKIKLEFLSLKQEQASQAAFKEIIKRFESANTNITVDLQSMNADQLKTTLRARAASDEMPDLVTG